MSSLILLQNIKRHYEVGDEIVRALDGVDLTINHNEYISIMGPSGSGKSTLMNIIGCLDSPTNGSYFLNEKDVSKLEEEELAKIRNEQIGFILKKLAIFLTVGDILPPFTILSKVSNPT